MSRRADPLIGGDDKDNSDLGYSAENVGAVQKRLNELAMDNAASGGGWSGGPAEVVELPPGDLTRKIVDEMIERGNTKRAEPRGPEL